VDPRAEVMVVGQRVDTTTQTVQTMMGTSKDLTQSPAAAAMGAVRAKADPRVDLKARDTIQVVRAREDPREVRATVMAAKGEVETMMGA